MKECSSLSALDVSAAGFPLCFLNYAVSGRCKIFEFISTVTGLERVVGV
jgi:hypothetical protein